jgi:tryptophanyl-tRNA synthetase
MRMFLVEERFDKAQKPYISIRAKHTKPGAIEEIARRIEEEFPSIKRYNMHLDVFTHAPVAGSNIDAHMLRVEEIVRDVELEYGGYGFFLPAATYHRFVQGLTGGKMSSSVPESYIALTEPPEAAAGKVKRAKTGGRVTVEEQKNLGGSPEECTIYALLMSHLIEDDAQVKEIFDECKSGKRLCKACKAEAAELMFSFLKRHQEEREKAKEVLMKHELYKHWFR